MGWYENVFGWVDGMIPVAVWLEGWVGWGWFWWPPLVSTCGEITSTSPYNCRSQTLQPNAFSWILSSPLDQWYTSYRNLSSHYNWPYNDKTNKKVMCACMAIQQHASVWIFPQVGWVHPGWVGPIHPTKHRDNLQILDYPIPSTLMHQSKHYLSGPSMLICWM